MVGRALACVLAAGVGILAEEWEPPFEVQVASLRTQADYDVELLVGCILRSDVPQVEMAKDTAVVRGTALHWREDKAIVEDGAWSLEYRREEKRWVVHRRTFEVRDARRAPPPVRVEIAPWPGGFRLLLAGKQVGVVAPGRGPSRATDALAHAAGALLDRWWDEAQVPRAIVPVEIVASRCAPYGILEEVSRQLERLGVTGFEVSWY